MLFSDNLTNVMSGLGTGRAKSSYSHFTNTQYTEEELLTTYRQNWLAAKIVDIIAEDATREWRAWQAEKEQIDKIERMERMLGVQGKVQKAITLARLYGGAALYIGTNETDVSKPLNVEREKIRYLTPVSKRELSAGEIDNDIASEYFGQPSFYNLITRDIMVAIHPSRLVKFVGKPIPESFGLAFGYEQGWGDSVLVSCMAPILRTESTMANAGEVMFESQVGVMKVPDLADQLDEDGGTEKMLKAISTQMLAKGSIKSLIIDAAQDYTVSSQTFAGIPELIEAFQKEDSGAAGIPFTRLFGQSPGGLNSTGESDLRNHYDNIKSYQNLTVTPALHKLDELLIWNALGKRPQEVHYNWNNLWYPSAKEQAEIGKVVADTIKTLNDTGLFNSDALSASAVNLITERGVVPGLEGAIEEFGSEIEEEALPPTPERINSNDSAPRPLYVSRKVMNVSDITNWAKDQGFTDIEDDLHVTVAYSRTAVDWMAMGQGWADDNRGNMEVRPGGPRVVEPLGSEGAVVLMFASSDLYWRNRDMREKGASWDYEDYQPHVTITYKGDVDLGNVKPYTGKIVLGPEIFEEIK